MALGLEETELDVIKNENSNVNGFCCAMFDLWKKKSSSSHPFRWSTLDEALRSDAVKSIDLANKIDEERHQLKTNLGKSNYMIIIIITLFLIQISIMNSLIIGLH